MSKIIKIIGWQNKGDYALVTVQLDHGGEAVVYVGGSVEEYFAHGRLSAFIKKNKGIDNVS